MDSFTWLDMWLAPYVHALHILHHHGVLGACGQLSMRNPASPTSFFMTYQKAPGLVTGLDDVGLYHVSDAEPIGGTFGPFRLPPARPAPLERFIHSEIFKRYPDVNVPG
jgi:ribulose-5-phosphate 4-epimerase/fuculose-1-phosphate aldolase